VIEMNIKAKIIELYSQGYNTGEIARILGIAEAFVVSVIRKD
jgi:DNA-binding CsgD family transcriptional regulator